METWIRILVVLGILWFLYILWSRKIRREQENVKKYPKEDPLTPKFYRFENYTSELPKPDFSGGHIQDDYREFYREHFSEKSFYASGQYAMNSCSTTIDGINTSGGVGINVSSIPCELTPIPCNDLTSNASYVPINVSADNPYPGFVLSLSMGNVPPQHHGMVTDAISNHNPATDFYGTDANHTQYGRPMTTLADDGLYEVPWTYYPNGGYPYELKILPLHNSAACSGTNTTNNSNDYYSTTYPYTNINKGMIYNGFDINLEQDPLLPSGNQHVKAYVGQCQWETPAQSIVVNSIGYGISGQHHSDFGLEDMYICPIMPGGPYASAPTVFPTPNTATQEQCYRYANGFSYCTNYSGRTQYYRPDSVQSYWRLLPNQTTTPIWGQVASKSRPNEGSDASSLLYMTYIPDGTSTRAGTCNMATTFPDDEISPINAGSEGIRQTSVLSKTMSSRYSYSGICGIVNPDFEKLSFPIMDTNYSIQPTPQTGPFTTTSTSVTGNPGMGLISLMKYNLNGKTFDQISPLKLPTYNYYEYDYYYITKGAINSNNTGIQTLTQHRTALQKGAFVMNTSSVGNPSHSSGSSSTTTFSNQCSIQTPGSWNDTIKNALLTNLTTGTYLGGFYGINAICNSGFTEINWFKANGGFNNYDYMVYQWVHWQFMDMWFNYGKTKYPPANGDTIYSYITNTLYNKVINMVSMGDYFYNRSGQAFGRLATAASSIQTELGNLPSTAPSTKGIQMTIDQIFNSTIYVGPSLNQLMYSSFYAAGNIDKLSALAKGYYPGHNPNRSWMYGMYTEQRKKSRIYFDGYNADVNNRWASGAFRVNEPYEDFNQTRYGSNQVTNSSGGICNTLMGPSSPYTTPNITNTANTKDYQGVGDTYNQSSLSASQMILNRSVVVPYSIYQGKDANGNAVADNIQPTTFPRVYAVIKFMGGLQPDGTRQPLITFFWAHIPIYPGCGYPTANLDIVDLYGQNDYENNSYHDKIFLFYLLGEENVTRTQSVTNPDGTIGVVTATSGWKYDLNQKGIYPICEEDYYIEAVYHGNAFLARSLDDASIRLNIGNYNTYAENDITATVDTTILTNPSMLSPPSTSTSTTQSTGGPFGNFRFYARDNGVFIYKDKANNGDFTVYSGLIPVQGMANCVGFKCWTPFRESDNSQSVFKSIVIQQGANSASMQTAPNANSSPSSYPGGPAPTQVPDSSSSLSTDPGSSFNNVQYQYENMDNYRIMKNPVHPEQVLRPVIQNSNQFANEGWKIINIGGDGNGNATTTWVQPKKLQQFRINSDNTVTDLYFSSGSAQLNKWGLPASSNIIKGEWIQMNCNARNSIKSYSMQSRAGYGNDTTATGPTVEGSGLGLALDRTITDWVFLGSTDNSNWVFLDRRSNVSFTDSTANQTFTITYPITQQSNPPSYQYFRWVIVGVHQNNMDLVWDVGNIHLNDMNNNVILGSSYSTSITDQIVPNIQLQSDTNTYFYPNNGPTSFPYAAITESFPYAGSIPSTTYSTIQGVQNGAQPTFDKSYIYNTQNNQTYAYNPVESSMNTFTSINGTNVFYNSTANANANANNQWISYAFGNGTGNIASIHLNHYLYRWQEIHTQLKAGTLTSDGKNPQTSGPYYYEPTFIGASNGIQSTIPSNYISYSYNGRTSNNLLNGYTDANINNQFAGLGMLKDTYFSDLLGKLGSTGSNLTLHAHYLDNPQTFAYSMRMNKKHWDKPYNMYPNRYQYRSYSGSTITYYTTSSAATTTISANEKPADTSTDPRFQWTAPYWSGSYLISPTPATPNAETYVPNYCFWIADATTYNNLVNAGVGISPYSNFTMNKKFDGDNKVYNNVPKRCLGSLYTNSSGTNLDTSSVSNLCPSAIQYRSLGWNLCYLSGSCTISNPSISTNMPNAIINKYNNIIFQFMDSYTATQYWNGETTSPHPSTNSYTTIYSTAGISVFTVPGGCKLCNCTAPRMAQSSESIHEIREPNEHNQCEGGICGDQSDYYYMRMKQINRQENTNVYKFENYTETRKWMDHELKKEFFESDAYKQAKKKQKDPGKEYFDPCASIASILAGLGNGILDVTYNPLTYLINKIRPSLGMKSIHIDAPSWSCPFPSLDEIFGAIASVGKAIYGGISSAFNAVGRVGLECITAISNFGKTLYNAISNFALSAFNTISNALVSFASGVCSFFRGLKDITFASALQSIQSFGAAALNTLGVIGGAAWAAISAIGGSTLAYLTTAVSSLVSTIANTIAGVVSSIVNAVVNFFNNIVNAVASAVKNAIDSAVSAIANVAQKIWGWFSSWF